MKHVSVGGLDVSRLGLGAMTMAGTYTSEGAVDDAESIRTIHRALDLGVTYLDTAEVYGPLPQWRWSAGPWRAAATRSSSPPSSASSGTATASSPARSTAALPTSEPP